jgi:hypothetical protein
MWHASATGLLDTTLALSLEVFVESLLSTALLGLHFAVLLLEATGLLLAGKDFLHEGALAILVLNPGGEVLGRALDDGTDLAVFRRLHLTTVLLVVAMRVEDVTHLQELQISLELRGKVGLRQVEPLGTGSRFLFLITEVSGGTTSKCVSSKAMWWKCLRVTMNK